MRPVERLPTREVSKSPAWFHRLPMSGPLATEPTKDTTECMEELVRERGLPPSFAPIDEASSSRSQSEPLLVETTPSAAVLGELPVLPLLVCSCWLDPAAPLCCDMAVTEPLSLPPRLLGLSEGQSPSASIQPTSASRRAHSESYEVADLESPSSERAAESTEWRRGSPTAGLAGGQP